MILQKPGFLPVWCDRHCGQAFRPLRRLQQLWLSGNRLRHVPRGLPASLQRLLLDFNRIVNLTDVFPTNSQVRVELSSRHRVVYGLG